MANVNFIQIIFASIGALIVTGAIAWIKRPRLFVLMPRLFSHSTLSDKGQFIEISVFNRGFKNEESVEVVLNKSFHYEIIGGTAPNIDLNNNIIKIPRVGVSGEVTALILVENGNFTKNDIINCLSKETEAKKITKHDELSPTGPQRIMLLIVAVITLLLMVYFIYSIIEDVARKTGRDDYAILGESSVALGEGVEKSGYLVIKDWKVPSYQKLTARKLLESFKSGDISVKLEPLRRSGELVSVLFAISNNTLDIIDVNIKFKSYQANQRMKPSDLYLRDIFVMPKTEESREKKIFAPVNVDNESESTIYFEISISEFSGEMLTLKKELTLDDLFAK